MAWELLFWLYAFVNVIALIFMTAHQLICLSDLECDYVNPYDSSSRINVIIIPEFAAQGVLCAFFLLSWHWFPFLVMAAITYYHVRLFMKKQHLMDATEIFRVLNGEKKYRIIKLVLYISIFLIVFYRRFGDSCHVGIARYAEDGERASDKPPYYKMLVTVAVLLMMDEEELDFRDGLL